MYPRYNIDLKLFIIVLTLISSVSLSLSLNTPFTIPSFHSLAFAQQNPVLPNYKVGQQAIEPARNLDNRTNLASGVLEPASKPHYQPITPSGNYYTSYNNSGRMNSHLISTTDTTKPAPASLVQPISSTNYQPITPAAATSEDSTKSIDNSKPVQHESSSGNEDYNGINSKDNYHETSSSGDHRHESDNEYYFGSNNFHDSQKSSSNDYNGNAHDRTNNYDDYHNSNEYGSHHNDDEDGSNTIIISSDNEYGDYEHDDHSQNYHDDFDDNNNDEGISIESSSGAFASVGGSGAFASAG
jgi:hypothetical protein